MNAQAILSTLLESHVPSSSLEEGALDSHILKAVFLAGSGGSGKGFIGAQAGLNSMGFRYVNIDDGFEHLLKKAGIDPTKDIFTKATQALREPAKRLMNARLRLYVNGKLPLVIDATAAKQAKTLDLKRRLEDEGYDTSMICVDVTLHRSIEGNKQRASRGGRNIDNHPAAPIRPNVDPGEDPSKVLDGSVLRTDWKDLQRAKVAYRNAWGRYYVAIDNNAFLDAEDVRRKLVPILYRTVLKLVAGPVRNPIGRQWVEANNAIAAAGRDLGGRTSGRGLGLDQRAIDPKTLADPHAGVASGARTNYRKFMQATGESFDADGIKAALLGEGGIPDEYLFNNPDSVNFVRDNVNGYDGFRVVASMNRRYKIQRFVRTLDAAKRLHAMLSNITQFSKPGDARKAIDSLVTKDWGGRDMTLDPEIGPTPKIGKISLP